MRRPVVVRYGDLVEEEEILNIGCSSRGAIIANMCM